MAKKVTAETGSTGKKVSLFKMIQKVDNTVETLEDSIMSKIPDWVSSGNYLLNATISGDLFKGFPGGRISILAGESGCGKSWLACSVCREAQKMGKKILYLDSEAAITPDFVSRLGVKTEGDWFMIKQVNTVTETTELIKGVCDAVCEARANGEQVDDLLIVLDSVGNLTTAHEQQAVGTVDMQKAQQIRKLFRISTLPLAKAGIAMICVSHTYSQIGAYVPTQVMNGGSGLKYASTVTLFLSALKLEDKLNDQAALKAIGAASVKKKGVRLKCTVEKSRFCIPHTVQGVQIPFYKAPNPYTGLYDYLNWDNAGIMVGKVYTEAEYQKLKPAEQTECKKFEWLNKETGELEPRYACEKKALTRGVGIVCKHLGRAVDPLTEFYSPTVFTPEFMEYINENIFKPEFELPSRDSFDDIEELQAELDLDESK